VFDAEIAKNGEMMVLAVEHPAGGSGRSGMTLDGIVLDLTLVTHTGNSDFAACPGTSGARTIPVVILTSSESPADRSELERLGLSAYLRKPTGLADLMRIGKEIAGRLSVSAGS
jgi:CheY-like chemotaxis protein